MMTDASATLCDVGFFDGRLGSAGNARRTRRVIRFIANNIAIGLAAVAAAGLAVAIVTFAAGWIVNASLSSNPHIQTRAVMGPGRLALSPYDPTLSGSPALTFADKWARATVSMPVAAVPLLPPSTQIAQLAPVASPVAAPERATPLPPKRPTEQANLVPLPRPNPAPQEVAPAVAPAPQLAAIAPPAAADKRAALEAHNKSPLLPDPASRTAVYDISARTVYLPNGKKLEAHSGLGDKRDDPRFVKVRMHGPTPPNVYDLALREQPFHGVRAIRLNPVDDDKMFGRDGMLAHSYMLGPNGQSNGCVSFKDYDKFLTAFLNGEVDRLVVVADLGGKPAHTARLERRDAYRYAANN